MSVSDSLLPLRMTEASIEGQEVQHIPLTGFAPCGLEKWGFRRYAPTSPVPRREGPYNQSLSAPLTSAFAFLWACDLSRDLLPAVAHPRSPAAGFAKGNKKGSSSKLGCLSISFCGERGIRTPGTVIPYGSLANCWFKPLTHLTSHPLSSASRRSAETAENRDDKGNSNLLFHQIILQYSLACRCQPGYS